MALKFLIAFLVLWLSILFFAPKKEIYYALEHRLKKQGIVLSGEKLEETPWGLRIYDAHISFQGMDLGRIGYIQISLFLVYNRLEIDHVALSKTVARIFPVTLTKGVALFDLLHPRKIFLEGEGSFGKVRGEADLSTRRVFLRLENSGAIRALQPYLKHDKGGWYYERRF